jgi:hypothetical protein
VTDTGQDLDAARLAAERVRDICAGRPDEWGNLPWLVDRALEVVGHYDSASTDALEMTPGELAAFGELAQYLDDPECVTLVCEVLVP